jgi:hypothetical protein
LRAVEAEMFSGAARSSIAGGVGGLFFGLVFGGALPRKWADAIFGERE